MVYEIRPWRATDTDDVLELIVTIQQVEFAGRLVETLLNWAGAGGFRSGYLGTTSVMNAANRFYAKHGFSQIEPDDLPPGSPRMVVDTVLFRRELIG